MAHRAYLFTALTDGAPHSTADTEIAVASYSLPLCWLATFFADDLRFRPSEDDEEDVAIPYLVTTVERAKAALTRRAAQLQEYFPGIESYIADWRRLLESCTQPYVRAEVYEIVMMMDAGVEELTAALAWLDQPTDTHARAMLDYTSITDICDRETGALKDALMTPSYIVGEITAPWLAPNTQPIVNLSQAAKPVVKPASPPAPEPTRPWWQFWKR